MAELPGGAGDFADIVAFLAEPASYPEPPAQVELIETHMSLVFLAGDRVYKMKKPVRMPFVDYRTLEARRINCEREIQLNRPLAPGVYLGMLPLHRKIGLGLSWSGDGEIIEWLVVMRRLDSARLLDRAAADGTLRPADIDGLGDLLARFYAATPRIRVSPAGLMCWWDENLALVEASLSDPLFAVPADLARPVCTVLRTFLRDSRATFGERIAQGCIVDGHGDLRPEHVHLGPPVRLIDRLEFDDRLRWSDPYDEAAYLGMECRRLGAPSVEPILLDRLRRILPPPLAPLLAFYRCYRAALRARLAIEHLRDPEPRTPERWRPQTEDYLRLALEALPGLQS